MCRYVALNKGIIEVRKDEGRPASAEGSSSGEFVQRAFDLTTQEGLEGYWAQLAQMSVDYRCACLECEDNLSVAERSLLNRQLRLLMHLLTVGGESAASLTRGLPARHGSSRPGSLRPQCQTS